MSLANEEPIYSQNDMNVALEATAKYKREVELSNQLLWAVVNQMGGHVQVPYQIWATGDEKRQLEMWDDPSTYKLNIRIKQPEPEEGE